MIQHYVAEQHEEIRLQPFTDDQEPHSTAITRPVTIGYRVTAPNIIAVRDMSYIIGCLRSGIVEGTDIKAKVLLCRSIGIHETIIKSVKKELPYFVGSLCRRSRSNANVELSWYAIFDFDHVDPKETKSRLMQLPFAKYIFDSVRDGVKMIVEFDRPIKNEAAYRKLYTWLLYMIRSKTGFECDHTPDWSRACYFSYDPFLYEATDYKPLDVNMAMSAATVLEDLNKATSIPEEQLNASVEKRDYADYAQDFDKARDICHKLAHCRLHYQDWIAVGFALYYCFGEQGKPLWNLFYQNPNYDDSWYDINRKWSSFRRADGRANWQTLVDIAGRYGCA